MPAAEKKGDPALKMITNFNGEILYKAILARQKLSLF